MNIVNGGAHADNNVDIQEFMIINFSCSGAAHYDLFTGVCCFHPGPDGVDGKYG